MADRTTYPIDEIRWILHACRADEPLSPEDPRRYDFTELRGGHSVITELADTLEQECNNGEHHHQILCGHRGVGKTTELLSLQKWANVNGFLCLWMDIEAYFGRSAQLHYSDFYLMAAEAVEIAMREEVGSPLPEERLEGIRQWFAEITGEEKRADKSIEASQSTDCFSPKGWKSKIISYSPNSHAATRSEINWTPIRSNC